MQNKQKTKLHISRKSCVWKKLIYVVHIPASLSLFTNQQLLCI